MFEELDIGQVSKENVRLAICQVRLVESQVRLINQEISSEELDNLERKLNPIFDDLMQNNVDVVVFPELSIPPSLIENIQEWSLKNNCIVVAGSHYFDDGETIVSQCPVIFPHEDKVYYTQKFTPSPFEVSVFAEDSLQSGRTRYIFRGTQIGSFAVLICSDYLEDESVGQLIQQDLDFIFVIACNRDSDRYHSLMGHHCKNSSSGVFIGYSNMSWKSHGDGKSSLFGMVDDAFLSRIQGYGISDLVPKQKIWEAASFNDYIIADCDTSVKKPVISKSVHERPNIIIKKTKHDHGPRRSKYGNAGNYRVVAFDMDGTLIRNIDFSWVSLWQHCGDDGTLWREYLRRYRNGDISYEHWCNSAVQYYKEFGLSKKDIEKIALDSSKLTHNFHEAIERLKSHGFKLALVSGGVDIFLRTLIPNFRDIFDDVFINHLSFDADGIISGVNVSDHDFEGKKVALEEICDRHHFDMKHVIYVGDTFNDEYALKAAGHSIVYTEERAREIFSLTAHKNIVGDDLLELVEYVEQITDLERLKIGSN